MNVMASLVYPTVLGTIRNAVIKVAKQYQIQIGKDQAT
jgi:hypothetical protein